MPTTRVSRAIGRITIQMSGQGTTDDLLRFEDFLKQLDAVRHAIRETERIVTGHKAQTVELRVVGLSRSSPANVELEVTRCDKKVDYTGPVVQRFFEGIQAIQYRRETPFGFDGDAVRAFADMGSRLGKSISAMELRANGDSVAVSETISRNAEWILGRREYTFGSVSGRLEKINVHNNQNVFCIYPIIGPASGVRCKFSPSLTQKAIEAVTHFVDVWGRLAYNPIDSFPEEVKAQSIQVREEPPIPPKLADLWGIAPDATGDLSSEDFIRELRDEWE